jgi:hypothetical protein
MTAIRVRSGPATPLGAAAMILGIDIGSQGAFAFGRSRGIVEGVLGACGLAATHVAPAGWKRAVGLFLASKDAARSEAIRRWPNHVSLFARASKTMGEARRR